jgi:hypothetical protein
MINRKAVAVFVLALSSLIVLPSAHADDLVFDQATKLTFNQSVQIPGRVLPAGTYWFVVIDNNVSLNVVQIYSSDRSQLYATVLTSTSERSKPADNTTITFAEREPAPTNAIVDWFYPGRTSGHEFVYSRSEGQELARAKRETVVAMSPAKHQTLAAMAPTLYVTAMTAN